MENPNNNNLENTIKKEEKKVKIKKEKKIRCLVCNKKVGLLGFKCKCGLMFCSGHLTPESHNCTFDYKKEQCKRLEKTLIKVVSNKVPPI